MNGMKRMMVAGFVAGVLASGTLVAAERGQPAAGAAGKGGSATIRMKQVTVTGILMKQDVVIADRARVRYLLVTDSGAKVRLPVATAADRKGTTWSAAKLAEFLNQNVKVVGMGSELKKGGESLIRLKTVRTVEKAAPAAPGPAAPAPAKVG
jgi:hypothetical protein